VGAREAVVTKGESQGGLSLFKWGRATIKSRDWKAGDYMLHLFLIRERIS